MASDSRNSSGEADTLPAQSRSAPPLDLAGTLDDYELQGRIGHGGMGEVWKAQDRRLGRPVAIKLLKDSGDDEGTQLLSEARAQAGVEHPHVCRVYAMGKQQGRPFVALEYIEGGRTLADVLLRLDARSLATVLRDVARGLHAAHATGLVHRDVKPSNVLIRETPEGPYPYVSDFGLARHVDAGDRTRTGVLRGTPAYMSPEQARADGKAVSHLADIYALGVVLYEGLTKRRPFEGEGSLDVMQRIIRDDPVSPRRVDPTIPADLEIITLKCLEKEPRRRYASAEALASDLQAWLDGEPIVARSASLAYRTKKRLRKHRTAIVFVALIAVSATAFGGYAWRQQHLHAELSRLQEQFTFDVAKSGMARRTAEMAPLHDLRPERQKVEAKLASLRAQLGALDGALKGPAHYAVGVTLSSLARYEEARRELELAWAAGQRSPDVAFQLGAVYAERHREAIEIASDAEARKAAEQLREKAVSYLRQAKGAQSQSADFVEALLAWHERRWQDALDRTRAARRDNPTLYESYALEGLIQTHRAREHWTAGVAADRELAEARRAFEAAVAIARSSEISLNGACRLAADATLAALVTQRDPAAAAKETEAACDRFLQAMPDDARAYEAKADALRAMASYRVAHGLDAEDVWRRVFELAEHSVELDSKSAPRLRSLAIHRLLYAENVARRGQDPSAQLTKVVADVEHLFQLMPRSLDGELMLCQAWSMRGDWQAAHNTDAAAAYQTGIGAGERALAIGRDAMETTRGRVCLANALFSRADWLSQVERDPSPDLKRALEVLGPANQKNTFVKQAECIAGLRLGEQEVKADRSPLALLAAAETACQDAVALTPSADALLNASEPLLVKVSWQLEHDEDASESLSAAKALLTRALGIDPKHTQAHASLGDVEAAEGHIEAKHGRSPLVLYARALANLREPDRAAQVAQLYADIAEWKINHKQNADMDISAGLKAADQAHTAEPHGLVSELARAHLLISQAHAQRAGRDKSLQSAETVIGSIRNRDAHTRRLTEPLLAEIGRLRLEQR